MKTSKIVHLIALAGFIVAPSWAAKAPPIHVEVMHWLISPGDAAALTVLRSGVEEEGDKWIDAPMPGAGTTGWNAAVDRIVGGNPPAVFEYPLGSELSDLAREQLIEPVPVLPQQYSNALPQAVLRVARIGERMWAVPVDIRGENWMFFNRAVLQSAHLGVPTNWSELLSAAAKLKAEGKTAIALGGQPWQERLLFDDIVLGVGGRDFYRRVYERLDINAINSKTMLAVFKTFGELKAYVDKGSPGRRWNQTTLMLIHGGAAFQFMGDWAKDEIVTVGLTPGREIGCTLAPAREASYIMSVDAFALARTNNPKIKAAQQLFARVVEDRALQQKFARRLGAIPARTDIAIDGFDVCSARAMTIIRNPQAQLMDPGLSLRHGLPGALDDAITTFWNSKVMSPEEGVHLVRQAVEEYQ